MSSSVKRRRVAAEHTLSCQRDLKETLEEESRNPSSSPLHSTCHRRWITSTTSPEFPPLVGWPGRTSWTPTWSAACWSATEPSARRAWLSATSPTDTRQSTSRLALTSSQVSPMDCCSNFSTHSLICLILLFSPQYKYFCYLNTNVLPLLFQMVFYLRCHWGSFISVLPFKKKH